MSPKVYIFTFLARTDVGRTVHEGPKRRFRKNLIGEPPAPTAAAPRADGCAGQGRDSG